MDQRLKVIPAKTCAIVKEKNVDYIEVKIKHLLCILEGRWLHRLGPYQ